MVRRRRSLAMKVAAFLLDVSFYPRYRSILNEFFENSALIIMESTCTVFVQWYSTWWICQRTEYHTIYIFRTQPNLV